jgi:Domain of unknown function (DUF4440)
MPLPVVRAMGDTRRRYEHHGVARVTENDETALIELERRLQEAVRQHDRASLEALLGDEFRTTGSSRLGTVDRDEWLALATEGIEWVSFEFRSARSMVLGDVGVVASVVNRRGTVAGEDTSGEFATIDTWLRREGRWRIINRVVLPLELDR